VERTDAASKKIEKIIEDLPGVNTSFVLGGLDIATGTSNSNVATVIATLKPWDERKSPETQLTAILGRAYAGFAQVPEAFTFAFGLPPILGLSTTGGFQFMLEDRAGADIATLSRTADRFWWMPHGGIPNWRVSSAPFARTFPHTASTWTPQNCKRWACR